MYVSSFLMISLTTNMFTLSLHDALPILGDLLARRHRVILVDRPGHGWSARDRPEDSTPRSEEHTSELQSLTNLVCRLLLEKKNKKHPNSKSNSQEHT